MTGLAGLDWTNGTPVCWSTQTRLAIARVSSETTKYGMVTEDVRHVPT